MTFFPEFLILETPKVISVANTFKLNHENYGYGIVSCTNDSFIKIHAYLSDTNFSREIISQLQQKHSETFFVVKTNCFTSLNYFTI